MKTEDIDQLENLLKDKDFAELTSNEKKWVLQHLSSEEAYMALRITEHHLAVSFADPLPLQPRPDIQATLRTKLSLNQQKPALWSRVWSHPVPVYQVAAGLVLLAGIFWFSFPVKPVSSTTIVHTRDTVFVTRKEIVVEEKKVFITRYKTRVAPDPMTTFRMNYDTTGMSLPAQIKNPTAQGISMKEDTLLQHFFVRENEK